VPKDPNRFWWLSLVFVVCSTVGLWLFECTMFPHSDGVVGGIVGFGLGSFLSALLEDYRDQNIH
jgi:hypothetical protein